jgi:outer membrane protein assembly factor BamA
MKKYLSLLVFFAVGFSLIAQEPATMDSRLPFEIDPEKRMSKDELEKKKEGWFMTGLGGPFSDQNTGNGFGGRIFLFNNGTKEDPFFAYTPYRHRFFLNLSNTTKKAQFHWLDWDAPYFLDTQWRVRANLIYDRNPNNLYFGIGESTLRPLSYRDRNEFGQPLRTNASFPEQQEALGFRREPRGPNEIVYFDNPYVNAYANQNFQFLQEQKVTDRMYNRYELEVPQANLSAERSYFNGLVRTVVGAKFSNNIVRTFDGTLQKARDPYFGNTSFPILNVDIPTVQGKTKVTEDTESGKIIGLNGGHVNLMRVGVVYDTRDFEPDPTRGIFAEVTHERSDKAWGSAYGFNRTFGSVRFFYSPFPHLFSKFVIASRLGLVSNEGNVPFFEYRNIWGTEGGLSGLGGRTTMRGYIQDRFVGPVMGFGNVELRYRVYQMPGFTFDVAPLFDFGRPWDRVKGINLKDYKHSYGLGIRIIWNQSTVIYLEWARSRETELGNYSKGPFAGSNFYLNFGHIF